MTKFLPGPASLPRLQMTIEGELTLERTISMLRATWAFSNSGTWESDALP